MLRIVFRAPRTGMSTTSINTLLFDWDGTLADSAPLGLAAFQKAFEEHGVSFSLEVYERTYSPNWYSIYESLGLPKKDWQRVDDLWLKHYGDQTAELVSGARETVLQLRRNGYRLGIVTSGSEARVLREIEHSGLAEMFEVIVCNEHIAKKKPHPEGLEIAINRLSCDRRECAYVGDAPEDVEMGKQADVLTVGVRSEYPSSKRLLAARPEIYIESIRELSLYFTRSDFGYQ